MIDAAGYDRFIPTPVGNTIISDRPPSIKAVHPHASGEHFLFIAPK
ncbi:hypothetical protein D1AOALGA4SA_11461 [Olavius algarvensis Delta 1 endosymbiont]|nr:hypothetical protein D1AOALGA4SA_11461 [Olavius algarvensis Delta 1 endosymbiont]